MATYSEQQQELRKQSDEIWMTRQQHERDAEKGMNATCDECKEANMAFPLIKFCSILQKLREEQTWTDVRIRW